MWTQVLAVTVATVVPSLLSSAPHRQGSWSGHDQQGKSLQSFCLSHDGKPGGRDKPHVQSALRHP